MLKLKEFCFGFSLRVGTLITLLMHIVIDVCLIYPLLTILTDSASVISFLMDALTNFISLYVSIQGIYGVLENERKWLIPYIAWNTFVAITFSGLIWKRLESQSTVHYGFHLPPMGYSPEENMAAQSELTVILLIVVHVYTTLAVYSYYKEVDTIENIYSVTFAREDGNLNSARQESV